MSRAEVAAAYDARAGEYLELLGSVAQLAPTDRSTIERWRDETGGRLLDAGCGPGHWSDLLSEGGRRDVLGIDASARFVESGRERFADLGFAVGDLAALPIASGSVGGILAWFSLIHTPPAEVPAILREFARVVTPGGSLALGFFDGEPGVPFDHAVTTAYHWSAGALGDLLGPCGFVVERAAARHDPGVRPQGDLVATFAPRP